MANFDWNEIVVTNDADIANEQVKDRMILVTGEKGDKGEDGRGIVQVKKTATTATYDVFTIEYTDGSKSTFSIDRVTDDTPDTSAKYYDFYLDAVNGSDENNGSFNKPFRTLQYAVNQIPVGGYGVITPKTAGKYDILPVTIGDKKITFLTYEDDIEFGNLILQDATIIFNSFSENHIINTGHIEANNSRIFFDNKEYSITHQINTLYNYAIELSNTNYLGADTTIIENNNNLVSSGVKADDGSYVTLGVIKFINPTTTGIHADYNSIVYYNSMSSDKGIRNREICYYGSYIYQIPPNEVFSYYVDSINGTNGDYGFHAAHAFKTLQYAINQIPINRKGIIHVLEGEYGNATIEDKSVDFVVETDNVTIGDLTLNRANVSFNRINEPFSVGPIDWYAFTIGAIDATDSYIRFDDNFKIFTAKDVSVNLLQSKFFANVNVTFERESGIISRAIRAENASHAYCNYLLFNSDASVAIASHSGSVVGYGGIQSNGHVSKNEATYAGGRIYTGEQSEYNYGMIADEFSEVADYNIGDYVMYNGNLYKFKNYHYAGAWNPSDVDQTTVTDEMVNWQIIANEFSESTQYAIGDYVINYGRLWRFIAPHNGIWLRQDVTVVNTANELKRIFKTYESQIAPVFDENTDYKIGDIVKNRDDSLLYRFVMNHPAGQWNGAEVVQTTIADYQKLKLDNTVVANDFTSGVSYNAGDCVMYDGKLYKFTSDHPAGAWNAQHVTATDVCSVIKAHTSEGKFWSSAIAKEFDETRSYHKDDYVTYNDYLWRFDTEHPAGAWNENHVTMVEVTNEFVTYFDLSNQLKNKINNFAVAPEFSENVSYTAGDRVTKDGRLYEFTASHSGVWNDSDVTTKSVASLITPIENTLKNRAPKWAVADDFKDFKQYNEGDFVLYNDSLYKFTVGHNPGAWNSQEAESVHLADVSASLSDELAQIAEELSTKQDALTFDSAPTENSDNPVTSGGLYNAFLQKAPLESPELTGTPTAPTAIRGTNTTQIATTQFVQDAIASAVANDFIFYVDNTSADASDDNDGHSSSSPFATIMKAVNSSPVIDKGKATIIINNSGTYNETVEITNKKIDFLITDSITVNAFYTTKSNISINEDANANNQAITIGKQVKITDSELKANSIQFTVGTDLTGALDKITISNSKVYFGDNSTVSIPIETDDPRVLLTVYTGITAKDLSYIYIDDYSTNLTKPAWVETGSIFCYGTYTNTSQEEYPIMNSAHTESGGRIYQGTGIDFGTLATMDDVPDNNLYGRKSGSWSLISDEFYTKDDANNLLFDKANVIIDTETGDPLTVNLTEFERQNIHSLVAEINPIQAESGDPSPDNVRAISANTSVSITANSYTRTKNFTPYAGMYWYETGGQQITFDGTVYGGSYDFVTGDLISDVIFATVTSCESIQTQNNITFAKLALTNKGRDYVLADYLKKVDFFAMLETENTICVSGHNIYIRINDLSTKAEYDTYLQQHPLHVAYSGGVTYPLHIGGLERNDIIGILYANPNIISTTNGSVSIAIARDTKTYIDKKQDILTFDEMPKANSENPVKSYGIKTAVDNLQTQVDNKEDLIIRTYEGSTVTFSLSETTPLQNCEISFEPRQPIADIKNLLQPFQSESQEGWTLAVDENGICKLSKTTTSSTWIGSPVPITLRAGTYTMSLNNPQEANIGSRTIIYMDLYYDEQLTKPITNCEVINSTINASKTFTISSGTYYCAIFTEKGKFTDYEFAPMIEIGDTHTSYVPYDPNFPTPENPIYGSTGINLSINNTTKAISWQSQAGTVFGGTYDVLSGILTSNYGEIASYNGETLPGKWLSDRDIYAYGTTPTIGAQVVYELATPITYQLTPDSITCISGKNTISTDVGSLDIMYMVNTKLKTYIDDGLATKQDALTFDSVPTANSTNPVTSGGVKTALDSKENTIIKTATGAIASFDDGVEAPVARLVTKIEPAQDLHGYDHPWPAGGGKNLWNEKGIGYWAASNGGWTSTVGNSQNYRSTFQFSASPGDQFVVSSANVNLSVCYICEWGNGSWIGSALVTKSGPVNGRYYYVFTVGSNTDTVAFSLDCRSRENVLTVTDIQLEKGNSVTDYEPYANICPISGWTGVNVTRTGKNLLPHTGQEIYINNGITFEVKRDIDGNIIYVIANGTANNAANFSFYSNAISYFGDYILSGCPAGGSNTSYRMEFYDNDNNKGYYEFGTGLLIPAETNGHVCRITCGVRTGYTVNNLIFKPMIRLASDPDDTYEPYQGNTYSITFPSEAGTVYGGELDVTTGKLTVDKELFTETGYGNWDTNSTNGFTLYHFMPYNITKYAGLSNWLRTASSTDKNGTPNVMFGSNNRHLYVSGITNHVEGITDLASWKAYLSEHPLQLTRPLATPRTYQLTPTEVTTLLGQNNIWADTGDITIDYFRNKELADAMDNTIVDYQKQVINKPDSMITDNIELTSTAAQNYEAGSLAIVQNQLLRITQNIATGGAITIGSNAETIDLETLIAEKAEKILVAKLPYLSTAELYNNTAEFHNTMPRGKDITAYLTDESLWNRINGANGYSLFEDLYVGDYLTAGGQQYMIVDFDYYIRTGDGYDVTPHHLVMMPTGNMSIPEGTVLYGSEDTLTLINTANYRAHTGDDTVTVSSQETAVYKKWNATMNAPGTNTTAGGYKYSRMRQVIMKAADTIVVNAFGSAHINPITVLYPNPADASASGLASNWTWFKDTDWSSDTRRSICDLPNEVQIYGTQAWGRGSAWNNGGYEIGIDKWQFALFKNNRARTNIRAGWWLRSVSSSTDACFVYYSGFATYYGTSNASGVRPRFLLFG